jgi:outer membrane protein assembly factor BamB
MALAEGAPPHKPLRVWPGVVAVTALLLARFGVKAVVPGFTGFSRGMIWSFWGAGAVLLWWLLLSRARWFERLGGLVLMAAGLGVAWQLRHPSMSLLWVVAYAVPGVCVALVAAAAVARRLPDGQRRATLAAALLLATCGWLLVRTEGISGDHVAKFGWRWTRNSEEKLLAQESVARLAPTPSPTPAAAPAPSATPEPTPAKASAKAKGVPREPPPPLPSVLPAAPTKPGADWPGFRGPGRDGVVHGVRIATDWAASPPVEVWRRAVGPGWSSFAVSGGFVYTQEQRGDDEIVSCYEEATGAPVWTHRDAARFFESNGGPGPRGTPTLAGGRVYTLGAMGILNALDARDGAVAWSRDAASDTEGTPSMAGGIKKVPDWGFSSSPLVLDDLVIVAVAGQLIGYDRATGNPRWLGPEGGGVSYSSPQLATIGGVPQVVLASGAGLTSVSPADGQPLWQHKWRGFPIVQPAFTSDGDVLLAVASDSGTRRLAVAPGAAGWTVEERWTSRGLKPYFNDFVVHEGHAYGFDGRILACIDLADGHQTWKGGRYGNGQLVLLAEQGVLLVLSEEGELALVGATPDAFHELARIPAIQGKTWNHPALAGDTLLVRNGEEMVAFRLALAGPRGEGAALR